MVSPVTVQQLKIFTAVCDCGGMTAAADVLSTNQPAVSQAVAELETHFGTKLFDRMGRKLNLTQSGRHLLQFARHITDTYAEMEKGVDSWEDTSILRVAASVTIGSRLLPEYARTMQQRMPEVQLEVSIATNEEVENLLIENKTDLGLMEGSRRSSLLVQQNFMEDQMVFLCSPEHPWAGRTSITLEDLNDQRFILREKGTAGREILDNILRLQGVEPRITWQSVSTQAIIQAVHHNLGVSLLSLRMVEHAVRDGDIRIVTLQGVPLLRKFSVVYHKNKYLNAAAEEFISICLEDNRSS